jgi:lysophospholipid acyltransferase (LPLAT)-like uncharacterized protein
MYSLWHAQVMLSYLYGYRFEDLGNSVAIAVGDERYNVLLNLFSLIGVESYAVNMKGNPVAAGRSVLQLIKAMKTGKQGIIAPDGPDGPSFVPKLGVALIARKTNAAVLPVGVWTRHAYQLRRWDRYMVPLPFARVHLVFGKAILVESDTEAETLLAQIAEAMHTARTRAQILAGIEPWR